MLLGLKKLEARGKDRDKHKTKNLKLTFRELMAKYQRWNEAKKTTNRPRR